MAQERGAVVGAAARAASESDLHSRAVAAGFTDLHAMLAATSDLPAREVAGMLSVAVRRMWALRRRHGYVSGGAGRPPGLAAGQTRQCRACGGFYRGLGQHIALKHGMTLDAYLRAYPSDATELERTAGDRAADPRRGPVPLDELSALRRGLQPEDHGRLLCRECGRWYRVLGQHLTMKHQLDPTTYRHRYGLPEDLSLLGSATRQLHAAKAQQRAQDPSRRPTRRERAEQTRADRNALLEQRAHDAGHADLATLLNAIIDAPAADVAAVLDVPVQAVYPLRRQHCDDWTRPRLASSPALTADELAAVIVGTQPERDGRLVCLECGKWQRGLGQHVRSVHNLTPAQYRAVHELPAGQRLQAADLRERQAELGRQRFDRVRDKMLAAAADPQRKADRARAAAVARAESRRRAGGRIATERNKEHLRELRTAEAAARHAAKARELGYTASSS
ncbi:MucR family transcriptional regulator [Hamadaea sp. NPDC051192]|uniref:MucR family transcriptional regulator n=1 Tax=Hamadaea sp. NPDC051192 TaxID=3154940 RepID=UPI0034388432